MNVRTRRLLLVWGSLVLLLLLVSALPNLTFAPHRLVALNSSSQNPIDAILQSIRLMVMLAMPLFVVFLLLFFPVLRTRWTLIALGLILLALITIAWLLVQVPVAERPVPTPGTPTQGELAEPAVIQPTSVPLVEPEPLPAPPSWVPFLLSFIAVTSILALSLFLSWRFWPRPAAESLLLELSREVEGALEELEQGQSLRNVVVRCYMEMGRVLNETRGIKRAQTMTPREFELELAQLGLPSEPVTGLTRLFESVRYGTQQPDADVERQAIESLEAIVVACREAI